MARPVPGELRGRRRAPAAALGIERGGQLYSRPAAAGHDPWESVLLERGLAQQVVELAHLDAFDQRGDFRVGVDQRGAVRVPRIPDRELVAAQLGQFHTGTLRVAGTALTPAGTLDLGRRNSVVDFHSSMTSSSIPLKISIVRSGDSPSTLRRSMTSVYFSTSSRLSR